MPSEIDGRPLEELDGLRFLRRSSMTTMMTTARMTTTQARAIPHAAARPSPMGSAASTQRRNTGVTETVQELLLYPCINYGPFKCYVTQGVWGVKFPEKSIGEVQRYLCYEGVEGVTV